MTGVCIRRGHLEGHTGRIPCEDRHSAGSRMDWRGVGEAPLMPLWWEIRSNRGKKSELGKMGICGQRTRNPLCASVVAACKDKDAASERREGPHMTSPQLSLPFLELEHLTQM